VRKPTRAGSPSSTSGSLKVTKRILFDATRLAMRGRSNSPTGIDRVVLAYARWLVSRPDLDVVPVATWRGKLMPLRPGCLPGLTARAQAMSTESGVRDLKWVALRNALEMDSAPDWGLRPSHKPDKPDRKLADGLETVWLFMGGKLEPRAGDIYLNVAHSGLEQPDLLAGLVDQGVAPVVMVHDLIPLTHPEFCGPNAAAKHEGRVRGLLKFAALVLVNSSTTAEELGRYASLRSLRQPPIEVALLGLEEAFLCDRADRTTRRPYFITVGTIEARKNLAFLLTAWRRLAETMGPKAPHLVLVGRRGWENEAVIDHLDRSSAVRKLVHEITDLTDEQVAALIRGSRALLAPSLAEGFDLPVIEALTLGAPVIASDIPVHRELARAAQLIDPLDGLGWIEAIQSACDHPPRRPRRPAYSWDEHFKIVAQALGLEADAPGPLRQVVNV
jgi:glycosyltransferase involved in cell wall biosynthesis